jgi:hypothetical protein
VGFLLQESDLDALGCPRFPGEVVVLTCHDLEQGRFARAIEAQHADLGAGEERQPDVLQHLLAAWEGLVQTLHHVDVLIRCHGRGF